MESTDNTKEINNFTPFFLVYGAEAVLPSDLMFDSPRILAYIQQDAEDARHDSLDLLDKERDVALARSAIYQLNLRRYHSRRVRQRSFRVGDLVLRLVQNRKGLHKLSPPWEGPFVVSKALLNGSYYLVDIKDGYRKVRGKKRKRKSTTSTTKPRGLGTLSSYILSTLSNLSL